MLVTLNQIADAMDMNRQRFKTFFNVLSPPIQRHLIRPSKGGAGNSFVKFSLEDIYNVFRTLGVPFWDKKVETRLANMAESESANGY